MTRLSYPAYLNKELNELERRLSERNREALRLRRPLVITYLAARDEKKRRESEKELKSFSLNNGDLEQLRTRAKAAADRRFRDLAAEIRERFAGRWERRAQP